MGNETAAVKRPPGARRADTTGRKVVGDYTGQRAGDAAQAVRRAGLRPGLERSFGADPTLLGLVVSQEPQAGSALARNGMVTLHIAAPGNDSGAEDTAPAPPPEAAGPLEPAPSCERAPAPAALGGAGTDGEPREAAGGARRRRKPGLAGRAPEAFETAPALVPPARPGRACQAESGGEPEWAGRAEEERADKDDAAELPEETFEEDGFDGLTADEFVVHVDDVFAGRAGRWRAGRRVPRARGVRRDLRGRLTAHPWLAGSAAFAVGLWVLLGSVGALTGQHRATGHAAARLTERAPLARTGRAPSTRTSRTARPARRGVEIAPRAAARRGALPARRGRATAQPAKAARPRIAAAAPSVQARGSEPPPPPVEQASGGLFSP